MKTLATALMLSMSVLAAGAQAAEADQGPTRAQVQAELQQAKVSGQYTFGEEGYPAPIAQTSGLTSQQVQAELAQARNAGEVTFGNLDYPPVAAAEHATSLTRSQVQTQLAQAKSEGQVTFGNLDYPPLGS
jgi:DNA-binding transcriptional regulator LsrR (DeoR family)